MTDPTNSKVLKASEIGSYAYCERGWWLSRVLGYRSAHRESMALGEQAHLSHGSAVVASHRLERWGYIMVFLGVSLGLLTLIWWLASGTVG